MSRFLLSLLCGASLLIGGCAGKPTDKPSASPSVFKVDYDEKIREIQEDPRIPDESKQQTILALQREKAAGQMQTKEQPAP